MNTKYKILILAGFFCNFAENLIGPFYSIFVQKIGGDILTIGYSTVIYMIATGILIIAIGKLSDKWNKEWITIFGYTLFALNALGYIFISHPWQLFILQIISALGTACLTSPLTVLMAHNVNKNKEGLEWALSGGGNKIIIGLAVLAGTYLVKYLGFTTLFITIFTIDSIAVLIQLQLIFKKK
ncbi:MAG: MFS transporter [Candidatus Nomurabacteria bacterium]|nr:MFS transporter [Candidatus Nomurabacteria bacterium]